MCRRKNVSAHRSAHPSIPTAPSAYGSSANRSPSRYAERMCMESLSSSWFCILRFCTSPDGAWSAIEHRPFDRDRMRTRATMKRIFLRRVAVLLIAALGFAQASAALAACQMDRGTMSQAMAAQEPCGDCGTPVQVNANDAAVTTTCVAHCTSDLQLPNATVADPAIPTSVPRPVLSHVWPPAVSPPDSKASPPRTVPARILLHSYLI